MSKKKNLLNESTVRRFMKLANMEAIGDDFIGEGWGSKKGEYKRDHGHKAGDVGGHYKDYEDDTGEKKGDESDTGRGLDYVNEEELDVELEDVVDVEEVPEEDMEELAGDMEGKVEELVSAIADAIEGVTGVVVDVEGEEEVEVEELPVEELPVEDEVEVEDELEVPEELEELEEAEVTNTVDAEAIVQEVMKRVAARLLKNRSK